MDFDDIKFQVAWNEIRLKDEAERSNQIGNRISFISIIYTVFAVFSISLFQYIIDKQTGFSFIFALFFGLFLVLFVTSAVNLVRLLTPSEVAFTEEPKVFYETLKSEYLANGIEEGQVNDYLTISYLKQLEISVSHNIANNDKKSKFNFLAIRYALLALVPYSLCVTYMLTNEHEKVQKIEIINSNQHTMSKEQKPKVEPDKIIIRQPVFIKQNAEIREVKGGPPKGTKK